MSSEKNETVAEIVGLMRDEGYYRGFMGITNPLTDRMVSNLLDRIEAANGREVAELRELLTELANAADTAFSAISACGKLIGASDVSDSAYRKRLLERVAKMLKAQEGAKDGK